MTSLIDLLADLSWTASILLKITLLLATGWMGHFLLARRNPRWRVLLWRSTAAGLVLIPLLVPLAYLPLAVTLPLQSEEIDPPGPASQYETMETSEFADSNVSPAEQIVMSQPQSLSISFPAFSWKAWLQSNSGRIALLVWASVAAMLALRLWFGLMRIRRIVAAASRGPEPLQQALDRVRIHLQCRSKIALYSSPAVSTPLLTGLFRPVILLPRRMAAQQYADRLPAVLAHEVAHLQACDLIWTLLIRVLEVLLWFHPLVWKLRSAHSSACEEVCDSVAAWYVGDAESYSRTLAQLALEVLGKVQLAGGIPLARSAQITGRLRTLRERFCPQRLGRRRVWITMFAASLALILLGGLSLTYAEANPADPGARILHFPPDRSMGMIKVLDSEALKEDQALYNRVWQWNYETEDFREAQGDVMIPNGKKAGLFLYKEAFDDLSPLLKLKPDDLFILSSIGINWDDRIPLPARSMPPISRLTGLRYVNLSKTKTAAESMKQITRLQSLKMLAPPNNLTNADLSCVAQLNSLKILNLLECDRITNAGLNRFLPQLTNLEELVLYSQQISDAGLVCLAKLPRLSYLCIRYGNFTDAAMAHIGKCPSLRILDMISVPVTDAGLRQLSGLDKLEDLNLLDTEVTDQGLASLKSMPALKKLNLGKRRQEQTGQITDHGLASLSDIPSLESLDLPPWGITDAGLAHLEKLSALKHVWVGTSSNSSEIGDKGIESLAKLSRLEELHVGGNHITGLGLRHLARLPNVRTLSLICPNVTDQGLRELAALQSLQKLDLSCTNISISGLSALNPLKNLRDLQVQILEGIPQDDSAMDISGLTNLKRLWFTPEAHHKGKIIANRVRDQDLACLAKLTNLTQLTISHNSDITDAGIACLKELPNLQNLQCGSPNLTDQSLSHLANVKTLNYVTIYGNFTDAGLGHLEQLKALRSLRIYTANRLSPEAMQRLKDQLPHLRYFTVEPERELGRADRGTADSFADAAPAPAFELETLEGRKISLQDCRGKVVVLYFWATWCRPCVAGTGKLKTMYEDMKRSFGDEFEMIGLSMDDNDNLVRAHVEKYQLPWPQVRIGRLSRIAADYGVKDSAPKTYLIGPDGRLLLTPESPQVDTKAFVQKILREKKAG